MTASITSEIGTRTSTHSGSRSKPIVLSIVAAVVFAASFFKISDLDFWWHLKTGQIILQQKLIPHTEMYSYTAAGREYIDHEWLFQVIQYLAYSLGGAAGVIILKSMLVVCIYLLVASYLLKNRIEPRMILFLLLLSVAGARTRFIERPEIFSILFLVAEYLLIEEYLRSGKIRYLWLTIPVTVIWANCHAGVILGLVLQLVFAVGLLIERELSSRGYPVFHEARPPAIYALPALFACSAVAASLNPYGFRILMVPFQLTAIIDSGLLNNQEWQQPLPLHVPFFYACLVLALGFHIKHLRKVHVVNLLLTAFFGYISLKYIRNIGVYCVLMPLLIAPYLAAKVPRRKLANALLVLAVACFAFQIVYSPLEPGIGEASWFPAGVVRFTKQTNVQGNMINSYGFGGYLIWNLYPERKIFLDGRNEVYLPLLNRIRKVNTDERLWKGFLDEYKVDYALLNYVDSLEEVTILQKDRQPIKTFAPFTSTHFPRSAWALVYWDDVGMVLVRRSSANQSLLQREYTSVFPEGRLYQQMLGKSGRIDINQAIAELRRKLREDPGCRRAASMLASMLEMKR